LGDVGIDDCIEDCCLFGSAVVDLGQPVQPSGRLGSGSVSLVPGSWIDYYGFLSLPAM
jgi:hypothetical protein